MKLCSSDNHYTTSIKILLPSSLVVAASAAGAVIHRNIHGRGAVATSQRQGITLVMSNEDMDIIKITKLLEDWGLLIDEISKTVKKKIKE